MKKLLIGLMVTMSLASANTPAIDKRMCDVNVQVLKGDRALYNRSDAYGRIVAKQDMYDTMQNIVKYCEATRPTLVNQSYEAISLLQAEGYR